MKSKPKPQAPTVVIKGNRKNQRHYEEQDQNVIIIRADNQQEEKAHQQDRELRGDDIRQDCADKKAVFPLKQRHAVWAVMTDVKRMS